MTSHLESDDGVLPTDLKRCYRSVRHVLWRQSLDVGTAAEMDEALRALPARIVTVGDRASSWRERSISEEHPLLKCDRWMQIERRVADALEVDDISLLHGVYWLNEYSPGEWAPLHVDGYGDAQLVVYLAGDSAIELSLGVSKRVLEVCCGDAILFEASRIPHATLARDSTRVSIVARYFFTE